MRPIWSYLLLHYYSKRLQSLFYIKLMHRITNYKIRYFQFSALVHSLYVYFTATYKILTMAKRIKWYPLIWSIIQFTKCLHIIFLHHYSLLLFYKAFINHTSKLPWLICAKNQCLIFFQRIVNSRNNPNQESDWYCAFPNLQVWSLDSFSP